MKGLIRNLPMTRKLALLLLLPILGLLWLGAIKIADDVQQVSVMSGVINSAELSAALSETIHHMQVERGASGVFLSSRGEKFRDRLPGIRGDTDQSLQHLKARLEDRSTQADSAELLSQLAQLDQLRQKVDQLTATNVEMARIYTGMIRQMINLNRSIGAAVDNLQIAWSLSNLTNVIEMKERAGLERAMLGAVFTLGSVDQEWLVRITRNKGEFDAFAISFRRGATEQQRALMDTQLQGPTVKEVRRMQRLALEVPLGDPLQVDPSYWFDQSTKRIELIHEVEQQLAGEIQQMATEGYEAAWERLATLLVFSLAGLLAVIFMVVVVVRSIRHAVSEVEPALLRISERDLTARANYQGRDEFGRIASAMNRLGEELQNLVGEITGATTQVAAASEEASCVTLQTSSGVKQQRLETEQVATAINEMSATVRDIASSASRAADLANQVDRDAKQGKIELNETIQLIRTMAEKVSDTSQVIEKLKTESLEISSVLDVIRGIADQTNLLALNAAIEAARAGEHGRGFAVVADEVRQLAQRTQESTGNIQDMIERLQQGSGEAVSAMENCLAQANTGAERVSSTGDLLTAILEGVASINDMNAQIASAAEEQSSVTEEINRNVIKINDIALQTSAGAEQTAVTSTELAKLAEQQQSLVQRFIIA